MKRKEYNSRGEKQGDFIIGFFVMAGVLILGPVVASDDETAHALVCAALAQAADRPVVIDAFDERHAFAAALRAERFVVERPLVRMCRRPDAPFDARRRLQAISKEFAILGPEFA